MNKQLMKKTIGIAASAALMASVALSGSALAGPGKGPQASAGISTWCEITGEREGDMTVFIRTEDKSSGVAYGAEDIASAKVDLVTKDRGNQWSDPIDFETPTLFLGIDAAVTFNLCGVLDDLGKAINAQTSIKLTENSYPSSKDYYTAQCSANPGDDGVFGTGDDEPGGGLKTADYPYLGADCP
jgi:hypothetical protein